MREYEFLEKLQDEDLFMFKKCIRKLLDSTFIVKDKDEKLFDYLSYSSNRHNISQYLRLIGYDINVYLDLKFAMLIHCEEDTEGLKKYNHLKFKRDEISILLLLWMLFVERSTKYEDTYIAFGEIVDLEKSYSLNLKSNFFLNTLKKFKRFNLIDFVGSKLTEESLIKLYPTLQFTMNKEQLEQVIQEYIDDISHEDTEEDIETHLDENNDYEEES